ncbi:MAG: hypothetical protein EXS59_01640 [Candidatus Taylorbacteria bacterium]|nr:hypothetical protein [Candidatus Taylorbacteria bacterium]
MSNVQFDDGSYAAQRFAGVTQDEPVLVKFVIKTGIVKDAASANIVLIGVSICSFALAIYVLWQTLSVKPPPQNQNVILKIQAAQKR